MRNNSLNILVAGVIFVLLLIFFQDQKIQQSLIYSLGLEQDNYLSQNNKNLEQNITETGVINRVIDGDTVVLDDGRTIRYLNIDTPETKKPNTIVQCFGPESSAYNINLVQGKKVILKSDKENEDRYGRDLRLVFLYGRDTSKIENSVNAILVKEGLARTLIIEPNNTFEKEFFKIESEAKESKLGVWGNCANPFVD